MHDINLPEPCIAGLVAWDWRGSVRPDMHVSPVSLPDFGAPVRLVRFSWLCLILHLILLVSTSKRKAGCILEVTLWDGLVGGVFVGVWGGGGFIKDVLRFYLVIDTDYSLPAPLFSMLSQYS